jgi:[ribosomal protein S5]-alanine N-acetyltransferase
MTDMNIQPVIKTERLLLRPFELSDAEDVERLAGDPSISDTTLNIPYPYEEGMAAEWISTHKAKFEADELANFAVTLRDGGYLLGAIGLTLNRRFNRAELGYWIGKPYWGRGFCTEAAWAVLEYGFTQLNLNRIFASYLTRNPSSGRVMEKLHMRREGIHRQHVLKNGSYEDLIIYAILKEEWKRAEPQPRPSSGQSTLFTDDYPV